ncbi:glycogen synthase [Helcococcus massiliensis]|uniref:glycogen synthase n=1 Tax=Helcococcus massiliensis TaxID=2040290 RepID=UPI000CDEC8CD|nr:glycogen synthase [Helcococcus massiliensis]
MNILYIAAEATPFIKTGGLADVAGSLPKAINNQGHDIRLVLPLHGQIYEKYIDKLESLGSFEVDLIKKTVDVEVFHFNNQGLECYFLANKEFFDRNDLYGYEDDDLRYLLFSKASVLLLEFLDFKADILHANDWHSGLAILYQDYFARIKDFYKNTKSLYTIHNIIYQGTFDDIILGYMEMDLLNIYRESLDFYGKVSFMKAGIINSTAFNTVSKTYANEIKHKEYAYGLEEVINTHKDKLSGIINGIDYVKYNPKTDMRIESNYDVNSIDKKLANKTYLQKLYNLEVNKDIPLIGMVTRLAHMKGMDLLFEAFDQLIQEDVQFVLLGTGEANYENILRDYQNKYPKNVAARLYFSDQEANAIYAGSDLYMMPSITEPCGISQLIAMRYGAIPIVTETGGLEDTVHAYNKYTGEGNGFSFYDKKPDVLLETTKRAIETYRNKEEFIGLIKNAMNSKYDWENSSKEYIQLYRSL